jgi:hypothetical protein
MKWGGRAILLLVLCVWASSAWGRQISKPLNLMDGRTRTNLNHLLGLPSTASPEIPSGEMILMVDINRLRCSVYLFSETESPFPGQGLIADNIAENIDLPTKTWIKDEFGLRVSRVQCVGTSPGRTSSSLAVDLASLLQSAKVTKAKIRSFLVIEQKTTFEGIGSPQSVSPVGDKVWALPESSLPATKITVRAAWEPVGIFAFFFLTAVPVLGVVYIVRFVLTSVWKELEVTLIHRGFLLRSGILVAGIAAVAGPAYAYGWLESVGDSSFRLGGGALWVLIPCLIWIPALSVLKGMDASMKLAIKARNEPTSSDSTTSLPLVAYVSLDPSFVVVFTCLAHSHLLNRALWSRDWGMFGVMGGVMMVMVGYQFGGIAARYVGQYLWPVAPAHWPESSRLRQFAEAVRGPWRGKATYHLTLPIYESKPYAIRSLFGRSVWISPELIRDLSDAELQWAMIWTLESCRPKDRALQALVFIAPFVCFLGSIGVPRSIWPAVVGIFLTIILIFSANDLYDKVTFRIKKEAALRATHTTGDVESAVSVLNRMAEKGESPWMGKSEVGQRQLSRRLVEEFSTQWAKTQESP